MKTLIFSDTHLSLPFDEKKYRFLEKIIKQAERVIINGDFWEGYKISFDQFINSPWSKLFPLLKSKNTVYIYGNHDKKIYTNDNVSLFSDTQIDKYHLKVNGISYLIEHGHHILPLLDDVLKFKPPRLLVSAVNKVETRFFLRFKKRFLKYRYGYQNKIIKRRLKKLDQYLICGHTHYAEVDMKNGFINTGIIQNGLGQYLLVDDEKICFKEEWYS